ncbi:MAG: hypothetical protein BWY55_00203 [archaeon ADurb.Bin336]|nr:MAG: hypothetical protein BWY55_00203 [archaeon ADurb.Bin336]
MEENSVVQNNSIKLFQTNGVGPEKIRLFEDKKVRVKWDADEEDYYFSIVDVVAVLTENDFQTARNY